LMRVYEAFGLEAFVYSYGTYWESRVATHAVTLVRINRRLVVQDAYANIGLVDRRRSPLDVRDVLRALRRPGGSSAVRLDEPKRPAARDLIYSRADYAKYADQDHWPGGRNLLDCRETSRGLIACRATGVGWDRLVDVYMPSLERENPGWLRSLPGRTRTEKWLRLIQRPYAVSSSSQHASIDEFTSGPEGRLLNRLRAAAAGYALKDPERAAN
jgi:hypothetical protein